MPLRDRFPFLRPVTRERALDPSRADYAVRVPLLGTADLGAFPALVLAEVNALRRAAGLAALDDLLAGWPGDPANEPLVFALEFVDEVHLDFATFLDGRRAALLKSARPELVDFRGRLTLSVALCAFGIYVREGWLPDFVAAD
jgi:hypothetical protein